MGGELGGGEVVVRKVYPVPIPVSLGYWRMKECLDFSLRLKQEKKREKRKDNTPFTEKDVILGKMGESAFSILFEETTGIYLPVDLTVRKGWNDGGKDFILPRGCKLAGLSVDAKATTEGRDGRSNNLVVGRGLDDDEKLRRDFTADIGVLVWPSEVDEMKAVGWIASDDFWDKKALRHRKNLGHGPRWRMFWYNLNDMRILLEML